MQQPLHDVRFQPFLVKLTDNNTFLLDAGAMLFRLKVMAKPIGSGAMTHVAPIRMLRNVDRLQFEDPGRTISSKLQSELKLVIQSSNPVQ